MRSRVEDALKAIVQDAYGSPDEVLRLADVEPPEIRGDEVLVRVHATSVHADIWHVVHGVPLVLRLMGAGLGKPRHPVPGTDLAGTVAAVGKDVTSWRPGDEVFGEIVRRHQWTHGGTYAELAAAPADTLARKPANVTFEQAASVPTSGLIALRALRDEGRLRAGHKVLVNGAGGAVGTLAVQIARAFGAQVTGVDHGSKLEMIRSIGADHVVDYTADDITRATERYDLILDVASTLSRSACRSILGADGVYVLIGHDRYDARRHRWLGSLPRMVGIMVRSLFDRHLPRGSASFDRAQGLEVLRQLLESGQITPVVDRVFPLAEAPAAIRHLVSGQARGKILLAPPAPA